MRLQKGYLVYTGMLRGNIATLLQSVVLDAEITPVSSEYFATSADAHLVLGHITPGQYSCDTPDKKEKTTLAALRRLARVVCADLDEIGPDGAYQIAEQFWEKQRNVVCDQVQSHGCTIRCTPGLLQEVSGPPFSLRNLMELISPVSWDRIPMPCRLLRSVR